MRIKCSNTCEMISANWHRESTQKMVASVAIKEDAGHVVETEGPSWEVHRAEDCLSWL